jgi:hypothetical protein
MFNISNYDQDDFTATYSPEDNKLRLYTDVWMDKEDWLLMEAANWKWAPKQELFVCFWSITNEDFCMLLAGDIMPEEMTMVERAEAKTNRLLILAEKRVDQCVGFQRAANDLMMRLDNNQPVLIGHHSEKKANKQEKQLNSAIANAKNTGAAVGYWVWRAQGVVSHANHKNAPRTIYNRIKTLLADLRTAQRAINDAQRTLSLCERIAAQTDMELKEKHVRTLAGDYRHGFNTWSQLDKNEITPDQALDVIMENCTAIINGKKRARYINHVLNRLAYEQGQLSIVSLFDGALSPAILQTFLRTHGADKPKVTKSDYGWIVECSVNLPLHIGQGLTLELDDQEWRELMQNVGYDVPFKKPAPAPILNFNSDCPLVIDNPYTRGEKLSFDRLTMTKEEFNAVHSDRRDVRKSQCKTFRFKTVTIQKEGGRGYWDTTEHAVFITDSKVHDAPKGYLQGELS